MNRKTVLMAAIAIAFAVVAWGCTRQGFSGPQVVELAVTDRGFEPSEIEVKGGEPVTLLVTRTVEATCIHEIVLADFNVREELPLNQEVRITFTPEKTGEFRYMCPMDMIAGTMKVR